MPMLIVVCGTPFAGKSTLARRVADRFGYPEVDVDEAKVKLFGDRVDDHSLDQADWQEIYRKTDRRIAQYLGADRSVIDASRNFHRAGRLAAKAICREHGADLVTIHIDTLEHVTRRRLLANRQSPTRRDVSDDDFAAILVAWEPRAADERPIVYRFGDDPDEWMTRNASALVGG
jgi:predicted kinase